MFRIMQARSGYYYVQSPRPDWTRISPFYATKRQCRDFVAYERGLLRRGIVRNPRVVEYL